MAAGSRAPKTRQKKRQDAGLPPAASERLLGTLQALAEPLLADMGLELVEVQYRREGQGWVIRFFLDKEGGVSLDDCVEASREISARLEVEDPVDHAYHLEVSSPGLERPLKKKEDYLRFAGRRVRIKLRHPLEGGEEGRVLVGTLRGLEEEEAILEREEGVIRLALDTIAKARLTLD